MRVKKMTGRYIQAELYKKGKSLTGIGKKLHPKATPQAVWQVVHGKSKSERIRNVISEILNSPTNQLWPEAA